MTGVGDRARYDDVAAASDLVDGSLLAATLPDGTPICLYNRDGEFGAVGGVCTHAEFAMAEGSLHGDGTIECVWHGARFDCRTGAARRAPATDPLPVYAVRVERERILVGPQAAVTGVRP